MLRCSDPRDLDSILRPDVQAVVFTPAQLPAWLHELGDAVTAGSFELPRRILERATRDEIASWLDSSLPTGVVSASTRAALREDALVLVDRCGAWSGASQFRFRALTDVANSHCGYHVDTVISRDPPWGLLRVYCGPGTEYVDTDNVTSMREFYAYLSSRLHAAQRAAGGDPGERARAVEELATLDEQPAFLRDPDAVHRIPAGSIVALTHLDVRLHWSSHAKELAWVHRSPLTGGPRLIVSVTARGPAQPLADHQVRALGNRGVDRAQE